MLVSIEIPDDLYQKAKVVADRTFPGDSQSLGKALAASMVRFTSDGEIDLNPVEGQALKISGIPSWAVEQFVKRAADFYPDDQKDHPGWKRFLMDTILSLCDVDQRVFQITGIEADTMYRADELVKQMGFADFHSFVGRLLLDIRNDNYYGARLQTNDGIENTFTISVSNIPVRAAAALRAATEQMNKGLPEPLRFPLRSPVELVAFVLQQATDNGASFFGAVEELSKDVKNDAEKELRNAANGKRDGASASGTE